MRNFKTEGIIIRRTNFKDADRILTIFTKDQGKIAVKASGIRKIPSRRSPHVELLNHCVIGLYSGNKFPVLVEAQTLESFADIKSDLDKVGLAYHLCELIDGLCPENQENRAVFDLLKDTLTRLTNVEDSKTVVREFETELLSLLGYWDKEEFLKKDIDIDRFIETILERKLKSKAIFTKLVQK